MQLWTRDREEHDVSYVSTAVMTQTIAGARAKHASQGTGKSEGRAADAQEPPKRSTSALDFTTLGGVSQT
ncbi:hypothetical protein RB195_023154 [Necator americanus]|uniref:Uncharacterized protein n=1 Tax=Necator americanus TaxID=51031 RepID=A0ABR1EI26_NECAM